MSVATRLLHKSQRQTNRQTNPEVAKLTPMAYGTSLPAHPRTNCSPVLRTVTTVSVRKAHGQYVLHLLVFTPDDDDDLAVAQDERAGAARPRPRTAFGCRAIAFVRKHIVLDTGRTTYSYYELLAIPMIDVDARMGRVGRMEEETTYNETKRTVLD